MPEWRVPQIVTDAIASVSSSLSLSTLAMMRAIFATSSVCVGGSNSDRPSAEEDLRLVLQAPERLAVDDKVDSSRWNAVGSDLRLGPHRPRLSALLAACRSEDLNSRCSSCCRMVMASFHGRTVVRKAFHRRAAENAKIPSYGSASSAILYVRYDSTIPGVGMWELTF